MYPRVVRSAKFEIVKDWYRKYAHKVEIVVVDDLVHGSFKEALEGTFLFPSLMHEPRTDVRSASRCERRHPRCHALARSLRKQRRGVRGQSFGLATGSTLKLTNLVQQASIEGGVNILRQTEAAGIKNFVLISSIVAITDFSKTDTVTDKGA